MLSEKRRLDRNYGIVDTFVKKYPEEIKEMISDIQMIGGPKVDTGHPADQFVFDDGICENFTRVLNGELSIQQSMAAWKLALLEVMLGIGPR